MIASLNQILQAADFKDLVSHWGYTPLNQSLHIDRYESWLAEGHQGEMSYLVQHAPLKKEFENHPLWQSCLTLAFPYRPHPRSQNFPLQNLRVAHYAQGEDYHRWLKQYLLMIAQELQKKFPEHQFEVHTDSSPLPERALALNSGLGWIGRNTCLIHRDHGSFYLLGEIVSTWNPTAATPTSLDFCGHCRRCIDACPTQALHEDRTLDSRRCVSYWTIESRQIPSENLRSAFGDLFFGCDICQSVCPWNEKFLKQKAIQDAPPSPAGLIEELRWLLTSSGKQIDKKLQGTALDRAGSFGLKRNALIVVANLKLKELKMEINNLKTHERLGPLAQWALNQLENTP